MLLRVLANRSHSLLRAGYCWNKVPVTGIDPCNLAGLYSSAPGFKISQSAKSGFSMEGFAEGFSELTSEVLMTMCNDFGLGMTASIFLSAILIKACFLYPSFLGQKATVFSKELKNLRDTFQQKYKIGSLTANKEMINEARKQYKLDQRKLGILPGIFLLNMLQMPVFGFWFLNLRKICNLPEVFPEVQSEGILWFTDLSTYDPYFVLPVLAALFSSIGIIFSPIANVSEHPILDLVKPYVKYLPFMSIGMTAFFPSALNVYWLGLALAQLFSNLLFRNEVFRRYFLPKHDKKQNKSAKVYQILTSVGSRGSKELREHVIQETEPIKTIKKDTKEGQNAVKKKPLSANASQKK